MSRLERYRRQRIERRKLKLVVLSFIIIVLTGLCIADYSINSIMNNEQSLSMINVYKSGDTTIGVKLLDKNLDIDVSFFLNAYYWVRNRLGL